MAVSKKLPIRRRDGDLFFNHVYGDTIFMVQVTHECLADVFGSDGSPGGSGANGDVKSVKVWD